MSKGFLTSIWKFIYYTNVIYSLGFIWEIIKNLVNKKKIRKENGLKSGLNENLTVTIIISESIIILI